MRTIPLTQGKVALVDDADFERLNQHRWFAYKKQRKNRIIWYAARQLPRVNGKQKIRYMHQEIAEVTDPLLEVDHKNSDGLDNQRENLRPATRRQNMQNMLKASNRSSTLKGVVWHRRAQKWQAQIRVNGRNTYLGLFTDETVAGNAYQQAAEQHFGEFARA